MALWLDERGATDVDLVGGKGASLGELARNDFPVPDGFVVTVETYRRFLEETGIDEELHELVEDVDVEDGDALSEAAASARKLVRGTEIPEAIASEVLEAYDEFDAGTSVAVRSSATAEDLPEASFAGQQETYLHVDRDDLLDRVRDCWASLFTDRAVYYRQENGFDHREVGIAVVVQEMVDAEKSGVLFTSHPSTGANEVVIEAAWGLGEAVVSGAVTPDNYVIDAETGEPVETSIAEKNVKHVRAAGSGEVVERTVEDEKKTARVLSESEIERLCDLGRRVADHHDAPQDVEWAIEGGDLYLLQSRPITTLEDDASTGVPEPDDAGGDGEIDGLGASPGTATGTARIVTELDELDAIAEGDVIVAPMTTPDMVPAMKRSAAIVTDEGGMTSHAAIVSRELGVPAVVGAGEATDELDDGQFVEVDGDRGVVVPTDEAPVRTESTSTDRDESEAAAPEEGEATRAAGNDPITATGVKVNVSMPEAAKRAAATGADGVGLLRIEHMVLSLGKTPERYVEDHGEHAFVDELVEGIRTVAEAFYPRPVRVRTLDAPTDEFRELDGGEDEPRESNPMLGYRGIRRSLDNPEVFEHELRAFRRLYEKGYDNVEVMFPLVNDAKDARRAREHLAAAGIDPEERAWGVMVETPASALSIEGIVETGIDFVSFGTNDLTQYTLAVDRNNEQVADRFDETHPAVLRLIEETIEVCREHDVATSICGEAGSKPEMVTPLLEAGITSISANIDAVGDVRREVKRVEQRLLLDSIREGRTSDRHTR